LKSLDIKGVPPVKFQQIQRPQKTVTVGRMKIQTPSNGHAFILRRYDTGAVSITTLFRAAFPNASEQTEKDEIAWVSYNYDLQGANGGKDENRVRFSGRWAPVDVALMLADDYGLGNILPVLVAAEPPTLTSGNEGSVAPTPAKAATASPEKKPVGPLGSPGGPPPAKRRKEASRASTPARTAAAPTPARASRVKSPEPGPTPLPVRRSARQATRSPSPGVTKAPVSRASRKPPSRALAPIMAEETMVGEEESAAAEEQLKPNMADDIAEQHELIANLKAQRAAVAAENSSVATIVADSVTGEAASGSQAGSELAKRPREEEEEQLRFEFKEPETEERALVSNSRARMGSRLAPERKAALWGSLAFAVGLGAAAFIPSIASLSGFF